MILFKERLKSEVERIKLDFTEAQTPAKRKCVARKLKVKAKRVKMPNNSPLFDSPPPVEVKCSAHGTLETEAQTDTAPDIETEIEYALSLTVDQEFMDLLNQLKEVSGTVGKDEIQVIKRAMRALLDKISPIERKKRREARRLKKECKLETQTVSVSAAVRDQVYVRDGGQCTFLTAEDKRCECRTALQLDHIRPRAVGGTDEVKNLRLVCSAHNQLYAERFFGSEFMHRARSR